MPVSTTTNPVTHTAEVDVNSAFTRPTLSPLLDDKGKLSKTAPIIITLKNPNTKTCAGFKFLFLNLVPSILTSQNIKYILILFYILYHAM